MGFVACEELARDGEFKEGIEESKVIQALKEFLVDCRVVYEGERRGPDIVAYCKDVLIIEVRGAPSRYKVKGWGKGEPKSVSTVRNQFRSWSAMVIAELMEREHEWHTKSTDWVKHVLNEIGEKANVTFVAVLGYHKEYINVLEKRKEALKRLGYEIWLIDNKHRVCKYLATRKLVESRLNS